MNIKAYTMKLHPGKVAEYKKRHDEIWPELAELLSEHGIYDYSIHLDEETGVLFAIHKVSNNNKLEELANHKLMQQWWDYMADLMETNEDNSPKTKPLSPLFLLRNNHKVIK